MMFADAEGFWKTPNFFDIAGVLGLVLGLVSIWLTWWLAKQDIEKRLAKASKDASEAARVEIRRVAQAILSRGVGDAIRALELGREACGAKRWPRAVELCLSARQLVARCEGQPTAGESLRAELQRVMALLQACVDRLRAMPKVGTGELPPETLRGLDEAIIALHGADGRMSGIGPEETDGQ